MTDTRRAHALRPGDLVDVECLIADHGSAVEAEDIKAGVHWSVYEYDTLEEIVDVGTGIRLTFIQAGIFDVPADRLLEVVDHP